MTRFRAILPLALAALAAGCAEAPPPPADPAAVERLVASLDRQAGTNSASSAKIEKKLHRADRLAGTLVKVQPERIDPEVAAALIAR